MSTLVVDASVAAKWFFPESDSDRALAVYDLHLHQGMTLLAPDLLLAEIGNLLWKRRHDLDSSAARAILAILATSGIEYVPLEPLIFRAYELAASLGRPIYDSLYLALAQERGCDFVTADERLYNAVKDRLPMVKWLRYYEPTMTTDSSNMGSTS